MSKETSVMNPLRTRREGERGQLLVLFTIAIVVIIGMLGLVLDGGSAFAQRRDEQNVADLAAVAGADAYLTSAGDKIAAARNAANLIASRSTSPSRRAAPRSRSASPSRTPTTSRRSSGCPRGA